MSKPTSVDLDRLAEVWTAHLTRLDTDAQCLTRRARETQPSITRFVLAALAFVALLLAGCAVDKDGDGYDENTGKPIAVSAWESDDSSSNGCGPGGVEFLCGDPDPEPDPDWSIEVARHEAGHVAVARELGAGVVSAWLNPDGSGRVTVRGIPEDPRSVVTFYLGGQAAAGITADAGHDYAEIGKVLAGVPEGERDRIEDAARAEAARIVAERAGDIDRDAALLLANGRLS